MCGIVAYIGKKEVCPIIISGLKRLEYRGYDSSGIALAGNNTKAKVYKKKGKVSALENIIENKDTSGTIGIGHTRWATHGIPNDINAHPHTSMNGKFIVIHNGIIENYARLKRKLIDRGYKFESDTDTEVLTNLIEYIYLKGKVSAEMAVRLALSKVVGAYGIVVICTDETDKLIAARKGSPLVIGIGKDEHFIASDATPIIEHTNSVIYLNNDNIAIIKRSELTLKTIGNEELTPRIEQLTLEIDKIEKMVMTILCSKKYLSNPALF